MAEVVTVRYHEITGVDLLHLRELLEQYSDRHLKIGTFSAASNVTGILTAVHDVSILLHEYGALAFFDYATAAPYVRIDVNPVLTNIPQGHLAYKDAIVFSGHKFLGGPGCPGILVVKKRLLPQVCPQTTCDDDNSYKHISVSVERLEADRSGRGNGILRDRRSSSVFIEQRGA